MRTAGALSAPTPLERPGCGRDRRMPHQPHITLDCIIFGLQHFGGISNYWAKLVSHVDSEPALDCNLVLPSRIRFADFDALDASRLTASREHLDPRLTRYLPVRNANAQDVFHTSYYRLPAKRVTKYVVSVYDFTYERYRDGLAKWVHTMQKLRSIRRADVVLCISEATRRDVLLHCPDVDPGKLKVVHLGVDPEAYFPEPLDATGSAPRNCVLFVGQRGGYKRFDLAVQALRQSPLLTLGVVGPALSATEHELLTQQLGTRWAEFGPVHSSELRRLYSSAYAFVFPSDYEGFGLPVLEAMACGCPVIAADNSSLPEVGGDAALYAGSQQPQAYAQLLQSLEATAVRDQVVKAGLRRALQFPWSTTLQQTVALYR